MEHKNQNLRDAQDRDHNKWHKNENIELDLGKN